MILFLTSAETILWTPLERWSALWARSSVAYPIGPFDDSNRSASPRRRRTAILQHHPRNRAGRPDAAGRGSPRPDLHRRHRDRGEPDRRLLCAVPRTRRTLMGCDGAAARALGRLSNA